MRDSLRMLPTVLPMPSHRFVIYCSLLPMAGGKTYQLVTVRHYLSLHCPIVLYQIQSTWTPKYVSHGYVTRKRLCVRKTQCSRLLKQ
jgi:hypothetical protein